MSRKFPPLTCRDVKRILSNLGFAYRNTEGSHENWVKQNPFRKVTVDCPKAPFTDFLTKSMAAQAGVSRAVFYSHR